MLKALFYIFLFLVLGEVVRYLLDIHIAGNILAMILIFVALKVKLIKLETVKPASDKLIKYMVLFFVPYGVGMMVYLDVIKTNWVSIVVATVSSTIITLYVTAIIQQKLEKHE
jgi:holin-like protein